VILAPRFIIPAAVTKPSKTESPAVMFAPLAMVIASVAKVVMNTTLPVAPAETALFTATEAPLTPM